MRDAPLSTIVSVRVVYLARLREALGASTETLELSGDEMPTVDTVIAALCRRGEPWGRELAPARAVRFAVNQRLADRTHVVADGDEVALFPPVTGG